MGGGGEQDPGVPSTQLTAAPNLLTLDARIQTLFLHPSPLLQQPPLLMIVNAPGFVSGSFPVPHPRLGSGGSSPGREESGCTSALESSVYSPFPLC